ncbi:MAG: hypothetical protein N2111_14020 [Candidatus Sumerlaeaceae bacterium]|nr:hypothetical protein [Candidatus Sumerlaeaceae bacterium]
MNRTFAGNAIRALVMGFAALAAVPQAAYVVRLESPDSPAAVAVLENAADREGIRLTAPAQGVLLPWPPVKAQACAMWAMKP